MVYDILNCGPRNQFVTRGSGGELLIVHNCGCIKDPVTGEYFTIDHKPSFNTLMEILESAKAKCIIIVPFKGIIRELHRELVKAGRTVGVVNGDVTPTARKQIFTAFKTQDDPHDLLCHPKVMAHGLNLTEADMLVNYAPITGNEDYGQVIERFDREGQKNKMTIARMARHPMEWDLYKSIDADAVTQQSIMDLYRKVMDT